MATRTDIRDQQHLNEIDGYLELGMQDEALASIRLTLNNPLITAEEFDTCVFALLQMKQPEPWRKAVERAYDRLKKPDDDEIRSDMLNYYFGICEFGKAVEFFPRRRSKRLFDAWVMMHVCLELAHMREAKKIARICSGILETTEDDFLKAAMMDALANYYARMGRWNVALKLWQEAPNEPILQRQRLCGIVKVHLLQALEAARTGLAKVAAAQQHADLSMEVQLPGNNAALSRDAERDLKSLKDRIDKLLLAADSC